MRKGRTPGDIVRVQAEAVMWTDMPQESNLWCPAWWALPGREVGVLVALLEAEAERPRAGRPSIALVSVQSGIAWTRYDQVEAVP